MMKSSPAYFSVLPVLKRYGVILAALLLIVILLFAFLYFIVRRNFINEVRNHAITSGDVEQIRSPEDMTSEAYYRLESSLRELRDLTDDVKYVYVMRRSQKPGALPSDYEYVADIEDEDENRDGIIDESEKSQLPATPMTLRTFRPWSMPGTSPMRTPTSRRILRIRT